MSVLLFILTYFLGPQDPPTISWDRSTLKKVSSDRTGARYSGYARLIQLKDGTLLCTYEADGNVVVVKSSDLGGTWSGPVTIAAKADGYNMSVPYY